MERTRAVAAAALLIALMATPAAAQPSPADLELAKRHFELGRTYYERAAYDKALEAFEESYRLSNKAALLFNIGKCHEALGRLEQAIDHYERYLKSEETADPNLTARIENLRKRLEASRPPSAAPPPAPPPLAPSKGPAEAPTPPPEEPPPHPSRWMTWTGWSLVGVGGASMVASVVLGVFAKRKSDAVERYWQEGLRDWVQVSKFESEGKSLEVGQIVTLVAGIAIAGGGGAMLWLARKREARRAALTPSVGPGTVGLSSRWTF